MIPKDFDGKLLDIPARQCLASGQLSRTCNVEIYGEDLAPNYQTFARVFGEFGYRTTAAGKLHHYGTDQMQGWNRRIAGDCEVSDDFIANKQEKEFEKYHQYSDDAMDWKGLKWTDEKEIRRAGSGTSPYFLDDELTIQGTVNFIHKHFVNSYYDRAQPEKPLLLYVGLVNPHYPYIIEESKFNYYLNRVQLYKNQQPFDHSFLGKCPFMPGALIPGENIPERAVRRAMAAYYGNVETIDSQYERVLNALK